jgi:hypothetical protein
VDNSKYPVLEVLIVQGRFPGNLMMILLLLTMVESNMVYLSVGIKYSFVLKDIGMPSIVKLITELRLGLTGSVEIRGQPVSSGKSMAITEESGIE